VHGFRKLIYHVLCLYVRAEQLSDAALVRNQYRWWEEGELRDLCASVGLQVGVLMAGREGGRGRKEGSEGAAQCMWGGLQGLCTRSALLWLWTVL
jgi:hypothetical protein